MLEATSESHLSHFEPSRVLAMLRAALTLSSEPWPFVFRFQLPCLICAPQVKLSRHQQIIRRVSNDWALILSQLVFVWTRAVLVHTFAVCGCCLELDLPWSRNQLALQPNRVHKLIGLALVGFGAPWFPLVTEALIANAVLSDQVQLSFTAAMDGYWSFRMQLGGSLGEADCFARSRLQSKPLFLQRVMPEWLHRRGLWRTQLRLHSAAVSRQSRLLW